MPAAPPSEPALDPEVAALLRRDDAGLVAAVAQQHDTGEVLMLAWMDDEALRRTLSTGRPTPIRRLARGLGEVLRGADARHHVFALRVDQVFAVVGPLAGRRIAGEGDPGGAGLAHVAEIGRAHV